MSSTGTSSDQHLRLEARSQQDQRSQIGQTGPTDQRTRQGDRKRNVTKRMVSEESAGQDQIPKSEEHETGQKTRNIGKAAMRIVRISSPVNQMKNLCQYLPIATRLHGFPGPVSTAHMSTILVSRCVLCAAKQVRTPARLLKRGKR